MTILNSYNSEEGHASFLNPIDGHACYFNNSPGFSSNGAYAQIDVYDAIRLSNNFTFEFWIAASMIRGFSSDLPLLITQLSIDERSFDLTVTTSRLLQFRLERWPIGSRVLHFTESETNLLLNGGWNHFAMVDNVSSFLFYINGIYIRALEKPSDWPSTFDTGIRIARTRSSNYAALSISDFRIWNYVRSASQIQENFSQRVDSTEAGLVGYWKFDEGIGSTAFNSVPGNDAHLYNHTWFNPNESDYRTTLAYKETAVIADKPEIRVTHQYIEKAAICYTYIPNYPPFDWYPCFESTSNWANWEVVEYAGAKEDQVLRFVPPNTNNRPQGLFWLKKYAGNCLISASAKVDRVRTDQTAAGEPLHEYTGRTVFADVFEATTDDWSNGTLSNTIADGDNLQLTEGVFSGTRISIPIPLPYFENEEDAFFDPIEYSLIEWNETVPDGTDVIIETYIGFDGEIVDDDSEWSRALNNSPIYGIDEGSIFAENQVLWVRQTLLTPDLEKQPLLHDLAIQIMGVDLGEEYETPIVAGTRYFGIFARGSGMNRHTANCYVLSCSITSNGKRHRQLELGAYIDGEYGLLGGIHFDWQIDTFYQMKLFCSDKFIAGKIWETGQLEPLNYQVVVENELIPSEGSSFHFNGCFCFNASGTSGGLPNYYFDQFSYVPGMLGTRLHDTLTAELFSVRDGFKSWQAQTHTLEARGWGMYYGLAYGE